MILILLEFFKFIRLNIYEFTKLRMEIAFKIKLNRINIFS